MVSGYSNRGFVLLSVLVVLVLVGFILVRMASQGLQLTLAAKNRADQLQRDWAVHSLERVLLPQAGRILLEANEGQSGSVRSISKLVVLGDIRFRVTIADEDAKLNLNQLYLRRDLAGADAILRRNWPPVYGVAQRLRPAVHSDVLRSAFEEGSELPRAFDSWGQVYDLDHVSWDARSRFILQASDIVTLWGRPRLNYVRSDKSTLIEVLRLALDKPRATELADQLHSSPRIDIQAWMIGQDIDEAARKEVMSQLTEVSTCHSLKLEILSDTVESQISSHKFASIAILDQPIIHSETGDTVQLPPRFFRYIVR